MPPVREYVAVKVLILSDLGDPHAQAVMAALAALDHVEPELLDLSRFPTRLSLSMAFAAGKREFSLRSENGGKLDLARVGAVWWRRPQPFGLPTAMTDPQQRNFALSESMSAFRGLYHCLDAFWVNRPERDAEAIHKPWQLALAQEVGLEIPITLITSDPEAARAFWEQHTGNVIFKQFLAAPGTWRETRRLRPEDAALAGQVRHAPVIFQRFVEAEADIRVTVVGDDLFAAATDVRRAEYPVDVRLNLDVQYERYDLPASVSERLHALMRGLGLEYGAIDLRRTPEGQHVFLEINPAGQFLYIEMMTGQRIAAALASHLARRGGRRDAAA